MSVAWSVGLFVAGAAVIALLGPSVTALADRLADRTGIGEAVMGGIFLGAITSLPGITGSVTAAADGYASLALSNAIGGIAAQTVFLVVADILYRKANLEHAAASLQNMMQATLLVVLLCTMLAAMNTPPLTVLGVHPISPVLVVIYVLGMWMIHGTAEHPMWKPMITESTRTDQPDEPVADHGANRLMWLKFAGYAVAIVAAGWVVTKAVESLAEQTVLDESFAGAGLLAVATSLPELVTSIAAVRRGALTLAVGGIVGGNCFDTLFAAMADIAYRPGSLYHSATREEAFLIAVTALMISTLLLGLLRRQKLGIAGIGFESFLILVIYLGTLAVLILT